METSAKTKKRSLLTFFLNLLLFIFVFLTLVSICLNSKLVDKQYYKDAIITPEYITRVRNSINFSTEYIYTSFDIENGVFNDICTDEELYEYSDKYFDCLFGYLLADTDEFDYVRYPEEKFKTAIEAYYTENNYIFTETAIATIVYDFITVINTNLNAIRQGSLLDPIASFLRNDVVQFFSNNAVLYALIFFDILLLALCLIIGKSHFFSKIYYSSVAIFCATMLLFIPSAMLKLSDLPSKLLLIEDSFKACFEGLLTTGMETLFSTLLPIATVAAGLVIIGIILGSFAKKAK